MEDGPPRFPRGFSCPAVLRYRPCSLRLQVRDFHPLWSSFPAPFPYLALSLSAALQPRQDESRRFRLFPLRSPLLRDSRLISFPSGTEMFHFPEFAPAALFIHAAVPEHCPRRVSPFRNLRIAGCLAPPRSLSQLTTSFFAFRRLGIHPMLFVTCRSILFLPSLCNCQSRGPLSRAFLVGLERLELSTSRLSGVRSNHLSYRPESVAHRK